MKHINAAVRAQGVIWSACSECGRDWPFPVGFDPAHAREFVCAVCVAAIMAILQREETT